MQIVCRQTSSPRSADEVLWLCGATGRLSRRCGLISRTRDSESLNREVTDRVASFSSQAARIWLPSSALCGFIGLSPADNHRPPCSLSSRQTNRRIALYCEWCVLRVAGFVRIRMPATVSHRILANPATVSHRILANPATEKHSRLQRNISLCPERSLVTLRRPPWRKHPGKPSGFRGAVDCFRS